MPLYLNDEQTMLRDTARGFVADEAPVAHLRALRDARDADGFSRALWRRFGEMGFPGILAREADGGLGLGMVEAGVVLEEIGRNLTPSPFLMSGVGAVTALNAASDAQRGRWLPGIVAGETVAALAVDEGAKHRPDRIATRAEPSGNGFRLTGTKDFVLQGAAADLLLVSAATDAGPALFLVPGDAAKLGREPVRLLDASVGARITLDGVEVDGDARIGGGEGAAVLESVLDAVRLGASAEMLGVAGGAAERTIAYLKERTQFGRAIGSFQALQHRAAHLHAELEVARAAILKAAQLADAGDAQAGRMAAVAKATADRVGTLAVQEGVQMHGGIGMTDAHDIGLYMKRARLLAELFGDHDFHADRLARMAGY